MWREEEEKSKSRQEKRTKLKKIIPLFLGDKEWEYTRNKLLRDFIDSNQVRAFKFKSRLSFCLNSNLHRRPDRDTKAPQRPAVPLAPICWPTFILPFLSLWPNVVSFPSRVALHCESTVPTCLSLSFFSFNFSSFLLFCFFSFAITSFFFCLFPFCPFVIRRRP